MIYTYLPRGEPYVTERQVANSRHIYENGMQLIVSDSVRERIGKQWSDVLKFYEVPVLAVPLDGLPADLPYWPTQEQLADYKPNLGKWRKKQQ